MPAGKPAKISIAVMAFQLALFDVNELATLRASGKAFVRVFVADPLDPVLPHELQRGLAACFTVVVFEFSHGVTARRGGR